MVTINARYRYLKRVAAIAVFVLFGYILLVALEMFLFFACGCTSWYSASISRKVSSSVQTSIVRVGQAKLQLSLSPVTYAIPPSNQGLSEIEVTILEHLNPAGSDPEALTADISLLIAETTIPSPFVKYHTVPCLGTVRISWKKRNTWGSAEIFLHGEINVTVLGVCPTQEYERVIARALADAILSEVGRVTVKMDEANPSQ